MKIISITDINYPRILRKIKNPPQKLYVEGNLNILNHNIFAIIGSRNYTEYGEIQSRKFAKELCENGLVIVSGMALGIDTFAHIETIKNGGKTIAVLGCGFDNIYPEENIKLYELIIKSGGAVISEYAPCTKMQKKNFPYRNRIVSGLSVGTLVVEATHRSGTTITANNTWEQGKKVFCIPNCIDNKNSSGIINLLKKGAILVTKPEDILKEIIYENKENKINNKYLKRNMILEKNSENVLGNFYSKKEKNKSKINLEDKTQYLDIINLIDKIELSLLKNAKEKISEKKTYSEKTFLLDSNRKKEENKVIIRWNQFDENTRKIIIILNENCEMDSSNISEISNIQVQKVNSILTNLEIEDIIESSTGSKYKINNNIVFEN